MSIKAKFHTLPTLSLTLQPKSPSNSRWLSRLVEENMSLLSLAHVRVIQSHSLITSLKAHPYEFCDTTLPNVFEVGESCLE